MAFAGCESDRFDAALCGGRPIAAPTEVVSGGMLARLNTFSFTVGHGQNTPDYNIWADEDGDYGRSLTYRYEKHDSCPSTAALRLRYELDDVDQQMGLEYIDALETSEEELREIRSAFLRFADKPVFYSPSIVHDSEKVVQVIVHHHATRGDFVEISISEPEWFKKNWQK